jgi:hypothetical protein
VLALGSIGLIVPLDGVAFAASPQAATRAKRTEQVRTIFDVALNADGRLQGQVVDGKGAAKGDTAITISTVRGEVVGKVKADLDGMFATEIVKGGVYTIATNDTSVAVRVWTKGSAPPAAYDGVMIVEERGSVIRGQDCDDGCCNRRRRLLLLGAGGVILGGVIATAISQNSGS